MRVNKRKPVLPIGRTAMIAFEIELMREECCKAAQILTSRRLLDEPELEECARLDDALAEAHRLLQSTVARITISRLTRRSRAK